MHVGESKVPAAVVEGQFSVVQAEQVKNGSVQVMNVYGFVDRGVSEVIGRAVGHAALDASAGEQNGKAE